MARMRVFVVLVMAIAAGGVFAYGTYNYVQGIQPTSTQAIDTKPVVVAAVDLEVGAEISRDDVRVVQWPAATTWTFVRITFEVMSVGLFVGLTVATTSTRVPGNT